MTWGRVDDKLHCHEKAAEAGLEAMGLWVLALSWCRDLKKRDGFVPRSVVLEKCGRSAKRAEKLTGLLVAARLWAPVEGGWVFHDWADYQPDDEALSEIRTEAGRKGAAVTNAANAAKRQEAAAALAAAKQRLGDPSPNPSPNPGEIPPQAPPSGVVTTEPQRLDPFVASSLGGEWCSAIRLARGSHIAQPGVGELKKLVSATEAHWHNDGPDAAHYVPDVFAWYRAAIAAYCATGGVVSPWKFAEWLDNGRTATNGRKPQVPTQAPAPPGVPPAWAPRRPHAQRPEDDQPPTGTPQTGTDRPALRSVR